MLIFSGQMPNLIGITSRLQIYQLHVPQKGRFVPNFYNFDEIYQFVQKTTTSGHF
jgi:hypothetical protein